VRRAQVDETVPGAAVPCADPRWPLPLARRWRLVLLEDTAAAAAGLARWRAASDLETPSALSSSTSGRPKPPRTGAPCRTS